MFTVVITEKGGAQRRMEFDKNEVTIGRVQGNDIILPKGNVSKRHSRIVLKDNRFIVVDLKSTNGTYVNGRKITSPLVVKPGDKIYIGDFIMTVEEGPQPAAQPSPPQPAFEEPPPPAPPQQRRSGGAPPPLHRSSPGQPAAAPEPAPPPLPPKPEPEPEPPAPVASAPEPERYPLDEEPSGESPPPRVSGGRPRKSTMQQDAGAPAMPTTAPPAKRSASQPHMQAASPSAASAPAPAPKPAPIAAGPSVPDRPGLEGVLRAVVGRVSQNFDVRNADPGSLHDQHRRQHAQQLVEQVVGQLNGEGLLNDLDPEEVVAVSVQEIVGLGALESLLANDSVREIVVEGPRRIVADFGRGLERVNNGFFSSADAVVTVARRLIAQSGGTLEAGRHVHHTALPYGPHVTVILPPVAIRGPIIEIRRMASGPVADELIKQGVLNREILDLVRDAISARRTIAVLGPVGAGVTTLVGALTSLFADEDRIVSAEDVPDLAIARDGVVSLGTGGAGSGVRLRDVVRQAALMRADRIVVDDLRGPDTCDVFSELAARPGGDIVGVHGQGPAGMELVRQAKLGSHGANGAAAELVARAVQLVLELERDEDGAHRVVRVTEITGSEDGEINAQELFRFDGDFSSTGAQASFRA